jgi:hypothetical protein
MQTIKEEYTRKVSGEAYTYELEYTPGSDVNWRARVFRDGQIKGKPEGTLTDNTLEGPALQQYLLAYVEGMIERGMDIAE